MALELLLLIPKCHDCRHATKPTQWKDASDMWKISLNSFLFLRSIPLLLLSSLLIWNSYIDQTTLQLVVILLPLPPGYMGLQVSKHYAWSFLVFCLFSIGQTCSHTYMRSKPTGNCFYIFPLSFGDNLGDFFLNLKFQEAVKRKFQQLRLLC